MFKLIATFLGVKPLEEAPYKMTRRQKEMDEFLSESVDRYDLERRERILSRKGYYI